MSWSHLHRDGHVYFAKHQSWDVVKIGFSDRPHIRVTQLKFRRRYNRFWLLGAIPGKGQLERDILGRFQAARFPCPDGTEYFRYSLIANEIAELLAKKKSA
jgi:hypothetical protein